MSCPESIPVLVLCGKATTDIVADIIHRLEHPERSPLTSEERRLLGDVLRAYREMESRVLNGAWIARGKLVSRDGVLGLEGPDGKVTTLRSWMLFMLNRDVQITMEPVTPA